MSDYWADFNDLWDYADPAATETIFRARLAALPPQVDPGYRLQLLTQIARTHSLRRQFDQAHALLDEVEAQLAGQPLVEVRTLLERGRCYNSARQPEKALPLFERAAALAESIGAHAYAVDALHMLGIAAPPNQSLDWNLRALAYAESSEDPQARGWQGSLLNNLGWTFFDAQEYGKALDHFQRCASFFAAQPEKLDRFQIARWSEAKTLRAMGQPGEGLSILRELEAADRDDGFLDEELGECLLALGQAAEARPYFAAAHRKLSLIDWVTDDTERLARLQRLST